MQQLAADKFLELADMAADGALADEKCPRRLANGARSHGGVESFDRVKWG
jgi:hypothetical protein